MKINTLFNNNEQVSFNSYLQKCGIKNVDLYLSSMHIEPLEHYDNIHIVAKELLDSIKWGEKIYLLVDSDNDGFMSASMTYVFFKKVNPSLDIIPIFHNKNPKAHGLEDEEVMKILKSFEPSVLFITDAGTSDTKRCKKLKDLGWGIYIADHHLLSKENPYAQIVNNQLSENVENKYLSGCGVTFKVLQAIDILNDTNYSNDLISYVHCANVGDSCNFTSYENQSFRHWGLLNIHPNLLPFIEAFNQGITNHDFSFGMISKFNALIRVGSLEDKQQLFATLCGIGNVEDSIKRCNSCYSKQNRERDKLINDIKIISDTNIMLCKIEAKTPLTGLIANKLMSQYNKPIMLLHDRENGEVAGSVRSPIELRDVLNKCDLFSYNSGHQFAFGTAYQKSNEDGIIEYLHSLVTLPEAQIEVLQSYTSKSIPKSLWLEFDHSELFGQGINPKFHMTFEYDPQKMMYLDKYGVMLAYLTNDIFVKWQYIGKPKRTDLKLGYVNNNDKFIYEPSKQKYTMNVIGMINGENGFIVEDFWLEEFKQKTANDLF